VQFTRARCVETLIILLSILTIGAAQGQAQTATLRLTDPAGPTVVVVADQQVGPPADGIALVGAVNYSGAVGPNWTLTVTTGTTKPLSGDATQPLMDLTSVDANSLGPGILIVEFSETNFGPLPGGSVFAAGIGGTTVGTVSYSAFADAANIPFAPTTLLTTQGPFGPGAFDGTASSAATGPLPSYSLTQRVVFTHSRTGLSSSFGATLRANLGPTATPTETPTFTSTPTATLTPSATSTSTSTPASTLTPTPTATATHSVTRTLTATPTGSTTPTATRTATSTASLTPSPTHTRTATATPTRTSTSTPTQTLVEETPPPQLVPDLEIEKTFASGAGCLAGQTGDYVLRVRNIGEVPAVGPFTVTDPLPAGLTLASATGPGWDCSGSTAQNVTCAHGGTLNPGDPDLVITVKVTIGLAAGVVVVNQATVATLFGELNTTNNSSTEVTLCARGPLGVPAMTRGALAMALLVLSGVAARQLRTRSRQ